jgi:hypothetical protein
MAFNVKEAKKAGYTDAEIADYLSKETGFDVAGARSSGYKDDEIAAHLTGLQAESERPMARVKKFAGDTIDVISRGITGFANTNFDPVAVAQQKSIEKSRSVTSGLDGTAPAEKPADTIVPQPSATQAKERVMAEQTKPVLDQDIAADQDRMIVEDFKQRGWVDEEGKTTASGMVAKTLAERGTGVSQAVAFTGMPGTDEESLEQKEQIAGMLDERKKSDDTIGTASYSMLNGETDRALDYLKQNAAAGAVDAAISTLGIFVKPLRLPSIVTQGASEGGNTYRSSLEAGMSEEAALGRGAFQALTASLTELVGFAGADLLLGKLAKMAPAAQASLYKNAIASTAKAGATAGAVSFDEGGEEVFNSIANDLADKFGFSKLDMNEQARERMANPDILGNASESFVAGAMGGAVASPIAAGASVMQDMALLRTEQDINQGLSEGRHQLLDDQQLQELRGVATEINSEKPGAVDVSVVDAEIQRRADLGTISRAAEAGQREAAKEMGALEAAAILPATEALDAADILGDDNGLQNDGPAGLAESTVAPGPNLGEGGMADLAVQPDGTGLGDVASSTVQGSPAYQPAIGAMPEDAPLEEGPAAPALEEPAPLDASAHAAATSPVNDLPEPTDAQKEAGNYKKGAIKVGGLNISVENPQGSVRRSKADAVDKWETTMNDHYGYIKGVPARAPDKEHVDVYVKPGTAEAFAGDVYVVNQNDPKTWLFDEPKVMIGYDNQQEAEAAYRSNYTPDWNGVGSISPVPMEQFKSMLQDEKAFLKPIESPSAVPVTADLAGGVQQPIAPELEAAPAVDQSPLRQLVEALVKRRAAANQIGKSRPFQAALDKAKAAMNGEPVKPAAFKNAAVHFNKLDEETRRILMDLHDQVKNASVTPAPAASVAEDAPVQAEQPSRYWNDKKYKDTPLSARIPFDAFLRNTRNLNGDLHLGTRDGELDEVRLQHLDWIESALEDGKAVPPEVLADHNPDPKEYPLAYELKTGKKPEPASEDVPAEPIAETEQGEADGQQQRIEDLGEKIGGARKDTSAPIGRRTSAETLPEESEPAWRKRFIAMQNLVADDKAWRIYDNKAERFVSRETFSTEEDADKTIPVIAVAEKHHVHSGANGFEIWRRVTDRKRIKVVDQSFPTRDEAMRYLADNAETIMGIKTSFGEEIIAKPEKVVRSGSPRRNGNVKGQDFMDAFGFRGVEFGNWNNQDERQEVMNHAYDALLDMADILSIPPKALSLNGDLALAFGARGQGLSGARAHYERSYGVINLTKMKGAGALAHEWFHALDHYLGRQDGKAAAERTTNASGNKVFESKGRDKDYASTGFRAVNSGVREEVRQAFTQLMQGMFSKAEKYVEDTKKAEDWAGRTRDDVAQQLQAIRNDLSKHRDTTYYKRNNKPASDEQLAELDDYIERILNGEFLDTEYRANEAKAGRRFGNYRQSNDALDRISEIFKAVRGRSGFSAERTGVMDQVANALARYNTRLKMLKDAQEGSEKSRKVITQYAMNAKSIDQGRATDYWTTETEMGARAFSAYIEDKVNELGNKSDFLSYGSDNWRYMLLGIKPFPEGEERAAINADFDHLFKTFKTKETDKGVALFSRSDRVLFKPQQHEGFAKKLAQHVAMFKSGDQRKERAAGNDPVLISRTPVVLRQVMEADGSKPFKRQDALVGQGSTLYLKAGNAHSRSMHTGKISMDVLNRLPELLADPVAVFKSSAASEDPKSFKVLIDAADENGKPVIVALRPNVPMQQLNDAQVNFQATIFPTTWEQVQAWNKDGLLRYYNDKSPQAGGQEGSEFPLVSKPASSPQGAGSGDRAREGFDATIGVTASKVKVMTRSEIESLPPAAWSRGAGTGLSREQVQAYVDDIEVNWKNAPEVVIVDNMQDSRIRKQVRDDNERQLSQGADGQPEGFFDAGKVYIVASEMTGRRSVERVMFHETLGHFGLRGLFGRDLNSILDDIYVLRRKEVLAKAESYGLDITIQQERRLAAEEVLAEMAQANPQIGFVKRAIAAIRSWLRQHGFNLKLTDAEIIREFIEPARAFVQRGKQEADISDMMPAFDRGTDQTATPEFKKWFGDSKVVDADGKPLVVYHGTRKKFDTFSLSDRGLFGSGIYLADTREDAEQYTGRDNNVMELYASIQRPYYTKGNYAAGEEIDFDSPAIGFIREVFGDDADRVIQKAREEDDHANFGSDVREALEDMGHDGIIVSWPTGDRHIIAFYPEQIKSATDNVGSFDPNDPNIRFSRSGSSGWDAPEPSDWLDNVIYALQDKNVDLKRVTARIKDAVGDIEDRWNAYLQEELFHGRAAKRTKDFITEELDPLINDMRMRGVKMADFEEYLWARHAEERNEQIAKINPELPDGGSGMSTADARAYLAGLDDAKRRTFEALAKRVDAINKKSRQVLVDYGLESAETIKAWEAAYQNYVPLMREDMDAGFGNGSGQGYSVKGNASKRATGSKRAVVDILANIAQQRERNIMRGEKNRVATALIGLAKLNPNPDFWKADTVPKIRTVVPAKNIYEVMYHGAKVNEFTNKPAADKFIEYEGKPGFTINKVKVPESVEDLPDPNYKNRQNVIVARVPGKSGKINEHSVIFNEHDERAMRMAASLKNLDQDQIGELLGTASTVTRWFASINTQYNPIFGIINILRDTQGAALNLSSTELAGKQAAVLKLTLPAMRGIYKDVRGRRGDKSTDGDWSGLWEEFQKEGGQTGYRDMFRNARERADNMEHALDPEWWQKRAWGKAVSAGGVLAAPQQWLVSKPGKAIFDWLSDYNETLENSVRLAAYKVALDNGLSKQKAASLAKNLTVNFNRKGEMGRQIGALYAFFNASVQGTSRIAETLTGPAGKRIVAGGLLLGSMQAVAMALAGFDDDEPPEFVRDRNIIIPIGDGKYVTIAMPLGFNVLPGYGRVITEWALQGFTEPQKRIVHMIDMTLDMFNPIGNAGLSMQTLSPTAFDPLAALTENKDWTGRPIAKEDFNSLDPTPGFTRAKDTASAMSKALAYGINAISGGTDYKPGALSPTPDQIDYLIGQLTGGVGREYLKTEQTATSIVTGESLPIHKVPLAGRFYGDTKGQSSQAAAFYNNLREINEHENEIKGRRKAGEDVAEYRKAHPESRLINHANLAERQVQNLRKRKRALVEKGAADDEVRKIEERITKIMTKLNEQVKARKATGST